MSLAAGALVRYSSPAPERGFFSFKSGMTRSRRPPATLSDVIVVDTKYEGALDVSASPEEAFALVSDVGRSGSHFPAMARLEPVDDSGRWRWTMKEKGIGPVRMRAVYDAVYVSDEEQRTVTWAPPTRGAGDMESYGSWRIEALEGGGCRLHFSARTVVKVPAPGIMKRMVQGFAKEETISLKKEYVQRIRASLEGT